jgi:hypothetical protein
MRGLTLSALVLLAPATAMAQSDSDREAMFFGGASETPTSSTSSASTPRTGNREDSIFGESSSAPTPDVEAAKPGDFGWVDDKLDAARDYLDIGGFLWLRGQYNVVDAENPETFALQSPNFADLYLDARPNERVRAYLRGRLRYDPSVIEGSTGLFGTPQVQMRVQLDQLWLKFDVARTVFVTIGKERIKWGVGRFWIPTDFLNQQVLDPLSGVVLFDERLGVNMLKLHVPIESLGWNFYAIATTDEAFAPERVGGALKAEFLIAQTEIGLAANMRKDAPVRLGATVSTGLWLFDLRAEVAIERGNKQAFVRGQCRPNAFIDGVNRGTIDVTGTELGLDSYPEYFGEAYSREDDWIPRVTLGAELGLGVLQDDTLYLGTEYFYNNAGYGGSDLYYCLAARGSFTPFYLGEHYGAVYALLPSPGRWDDSTFVLSSIANLSDLSAVLRFDFTQLLFRFLSLNAFAQVHLGQAGDEFAFAVETIPLELPAGLPDSVTQDPTIQLLTAGLRVDKPILELGFGLRLNY